MSPKKRSSSLKKTCDFCVRRKRSCDGFALRRCSFCIATDQPVCYYGPRRRWGSQTSRSDCNTADDPVGRSFWRMDGEIAPFFTGGGGRVAPAGSGSCDRGMMLPLKRGQFSASPATGLIGLQENEFLGDFFDCLGFLSLTSESTVRGAMVGVMLAGGVSKKHQCNPGAPSAPRVLPGIVGEGAGGGFRQAVGESSDEIGDSAWSSALAAENGPGALPRDPSTCALWCAIALGALVRGFPLDHVGRYVELAQDSLWACYDGATLHTARAYIAMAILRNFLGEKVKSYQCVKLANSIVDALPPEQTPRGFRELLKYAGFAWAIETDLAPVEDTSSYWKNVAPVWQLSESVMERDVCGFVLSIVIPLNQPLMDEASARHVLAKQQQQQQQQQLPEIAPVATLPPAENPDLQDEEEVDRVCVENTEACAEAQKSVMPDMLRLEGCIGSSTTRFGLGGLLYYGELTYLKLLHKEAAMEELKASIQGCVEVVVRYPGLCRYNTWLHYVHILLQFLAMFQSRQQYEAARVAYNSVRPVGALPAPPFEKWRMSDVCDHASCRRLTMLLESIYSDYLGRKI